MEVPIWMSSNPINNPCLLYVDAVSQVQVLKQFWTMTEEYFTVESTTDRVLKNHRNWLAGICSSTVAADYLYNIHLYI